MADPSGGLGRSRGETDVVRLAARAFEPDRYLAALLAPRAVRDDLVTLAAFAGELGRIPGYVSEPMLGEIRLQWWRDTVAALTTGGGVATGHPIADALGRTMRRYEVEASLPLDLIDAQSARLADQPFADLAALTDNLARWDGTLFHLAWRILVRHDAVSAPPTAPSMLASAAEAYGLSRLLCELPAELAQGRCRVPRDLLEAHGVSLDPARGEADWTRWKGPLAVLSTHAVSALTRAAEGYQVAPRAVRCATLPLALVRPYLRACERADMTSFYVRDIGPLTRVWRLWLGHRTGWV